MFKKYFAALIPHLLMNVCPSTLPLIGLHAGKNDYGITLGPRNPLLYLPRKEYDCFCYQIDESVDDQTYAIIAK